MIDRNGISGHQVFINSIIARLSANADPDEECVQIFSLRENLLYEDRALSATFLNSAIHHLQLIKKSKLCETERRLAAIRSLNRASLDLPMIAE